MSEARYELVWPGKYAADGQRAAIPSCPADLQGIAWHGDPDAPPDRLLFGDNLAAMQRLEDELRGRVDLVYIDPPFATGGRFDVATLVGGVGGTGVGGVGEGTPVEVRLPAYSDRFEGGPAGLLQLLDPRLRLVHELLAPHGSLYVHVDPIVAHPLKLMLDEIFGPRCFQREIVWRIGWVSGFKTQARNWIRNHDTILFYTKDPRRFTFNKQLVPYAADYRRRDGSPPRGKGMPIEDVWNGSEVELELRGRDSLDSIQIKSFSTEKTGYATQKNESLLRRIVAASSNPGDLVMDVFCGAGTTLAVASELGRRFVGCDCGAPAVHLTTKRLLEAGQVRSLRIDRVEPAAIEVDGFVERVLAAHGATAVRGRRWAGRRGRTAVAVLGPDACLDEAALRRWAELARDSDLRRLEILARRVDLPVPRPALVGLTIDVYRITHEPGPTLAIAAVPELELDLDHGTIGLRDLRMPAMPTELQQAVERFDHWIDAVELGWDLGDGEPPRVVHHAYRTARQRELGLRWGPFEPPPGALALCLRIVDVAFGSSVVRIPLSAAEGVCQR